MIFTLTGLGQTDAQTKKNNILEFNLSVVNNDLWGQPIVPTLTYRTNRHLFYIGPKITFFDLNGGNFGYSFFLTKESKRFDPYINYDFQIGKNLLILLILCERGNRDIAMHNTLNFGINWNITDSFYANGSIGAGIKKSWYPGCSFTDFNLMIRFGLGFKLTKKEKGG